MEHQARRHLILLHPIRRLFGARARRLWIDLPDAHARLARLPASRVVRAAIKALIDEGVAVLRSNIDAPLIGQVLEEFAGYCERTSESRDYRDQYGLHERLCNLQMVSPAMRALAANATVREIMQAVFSAPPVVVGSLFFEKGSQQSIHRDGPAFFTVPINHFFGVWHALEDVSEDSGPLIYYERGHRVAPDDELRARDGLNEEVYFRTVREACEAMRLPKQHVVLAKGDTLIWHPQLPHGGASIADPARSRKSAVFHYIPVGVPIYGPKEFFGKAAPRASGPNYEVLSFDGALFYRHAAPKFFHNYADGNFKEV